MLATSLKLCTHRGPACSTACMHAQSLRAARLELCVRGRVTSGSTLRVLHVGHVHTCVITSQAAPVQKGKAAGAHSSLVACVTTQDGAQLADGAAVQLVSILQARAPAECICLASKCCVLLAQSQACKGLLMSLYASLSAGSRSRCSSSMRRAFCKDALHNLSARQTAYLKAVGQCSSCAQRAAPLEQGLLRRRREAACRLAL